MASRPEQVATPRPRSAPPAADARRIAATSRQLQLALLQTKIAALERTLEVERERRQSVVDRYERLLAEQ